MFKPGGKRILAFLDTKGNFVQRVVGILSIVPQLIYGLLHVDELLANPNYLIILAILIWLPLFFFVWMWAFQKKIDENDDDAYSTPSPISSKEEKYKFSSKKRTIITIGFAIITVIFALVLYLFMHEKNDLGNSIEGDCGIKNWNLTLKNGLYRADTIVTLTDGKRDTIYNLPVAKIRQPHNSGNAFVTDGFDCIYGLKLNFMDTITSVTILGITADVIDFTPYDPLNLCERDTAKKEYRKLHCVELPLRISDTSTNETQIANIILKEQKKFRITQSDTLYIRVTAKSKGVYTIGLNLIVELKSGDSCKVSLRNDLRYVFVDEEQK